MATATSDFEILGEEKDNSPFEVIGEESAKSPAEQKFESAVNTQAAASVQKPDLPPDLRKPLPIAPTSFGPFPTYVPTENTPEAQQHAAAVNASIHEANPATGFEHINRGMERYLGPSVYSDVPGKERVAGLDEATSGALQVTQPLMVAGAVSSLSSVPAALKFARDMVAIVGAQKASEIATRRFGLSPEASQLVSNGIGLAAPFVAAKTLGGGDVSVESPNLSAEQTTIGPKIAVAQAQSGPVTKLGIKIGSFERSAMWGTPEPSSATPPTLEGNAQPPTPPKPSVSPASPSMVQDAVSALARADRMDAGLPPEVPPPPPPAPPPLPEVTPQSVAHIGDTLEGLPQEQRAPAIIKIHQQLAAALLQQGKVVGPDGHLHIIENDKQANSIAQKFINAEVDRRDKVAEEAQKAAEKKASKPAKAAPVQRPTRATLEQAKGPQLEVVGEEPAGVESRHANPEGSPAVQSGEKTVSASLAAPREPRGSENISASDGGQSGRIKETAGVESTHGTPVSVANVVPNPEHAVEVPANELRSGDVSGARVGDSVRGNDTGSNSPIEAGPSAGSEPPSEPTHEVIREEPAPLQKGDKVTLSDGRPATVKHASPTMNLVRLETDGGEKVTVSGAKEIAKLKPTQSAVEPTQSAVEPTQKASKPELAPGKVGEMKVSDLKVAPHKFQYKMGTDAEGVSTLLKDVTKFNPDLAGLVSVWKDPADGKTYVINGHHRYELAKRTGQKTLNVRHIEAPDAVAARAIGAQQNIADGRGTAVDAAKYFRDTGTTPEDLQKKGISLGEATAKNGLALSRLEPGMFGKVVSGDLRQGRAAAIGEATADHAEQKAILSLVERKERSGAKVSDDTLSELIRLVKGSEQTTETTADLFGAQQINRSLALEKAEISAHIKQQLAKDKKLFGFVAKEGRASELARAGNKIEVEKSKEISTQAAQAEEVYNKLSERGGPISSILDESARRLADGENAGTVKSDAYQQVRAEVYKTLGRPEGSSPERPERTSESERTTEGAASKSEVAVESKPEPTYKHRSTQANIPDTSEAGQALTAARGRISDSDLAGDGKDIGGNHVTVRYGLKAGTDVEGVKKYLSSLAPFEATLGKTDKFPPSEHSDGAAVIMAPIESPELHKINDEIQKHGQFAESSFNEYKPHATVAYVKADKADRYTGMPVTAGKKFKVDQIEITDREGGQQHVKLEGKPHESTQPAIPVQAPPKPLKKEVAAPKERPLKVGDVVTFSKVPPGSYLTTNTPFRVETAGKLHVQFRNVKTGGGTGENWSMLRLAEYAKEQPVEPTLPGMEKVPAERAEANAEQQGQDLTAKLTEPPKSIESAAGEMEQKSPLFRDTAANPQSGLFGNERGAVKAGALVPDKLADALHAIAETGAKLWDGYTAPPSWTDYDAMTRHWTGAEQASNVELQKFTNEIKELIPKKERREAISNWIEAAGDKSVLRERADASKTPYKDGYEAALDLTPDEQGVAEAIKERNDETLARSQAAGIVDEGVENYVQHIWDKTPDAARKILAEINFRSLKTTPAFSKERKLPTYFDGEQLGFKPVDKDIGFLTAVHEQSLNEALAARAYVKSLMQGKAEDGRPLATISRASAQEAPARDGQEAYLITPNLRPAEEYSDYGVVDHPALRGWRWADTVDGKAVFVQGDLRIHPEIHQRVKNNLSRSAVQTWTARIGTHEFHPGRVALRASSELKHIVLSFSGFHQTTLGVHALEHKVSPVNMPELDMDDPNQRFLVDHGLMVADYSAMGSFSEGVSGGGLMTKIPVLGPRYDQYQTYLFKSYLPRIKMAMAKASLERNRSRYRKELSEDQIGRLTADQANAAFGHLNLKALGRNPTFQDGLRLMLLAPDFLEARARFVGQSAKPYGREQLAALVLGAAVLYTLARLLNEMVDGDPHWDKPFSLVYKGKEYSFRTVQGDLAHLVTKPREFFMGRINPIVRTGVEASTGRDDLGRPRDLPATVKDYVRENVPIPAQSFTRHSSISTGEKIVQFMLKEIGVNDKTSRTPAEEEASRIARERLPAKEQKAADEGKYLLRQEILEGLRKGDSGPLNKAVSEGHITHEDAHKLRMRGRRTPLADKVNNFSPDEFKQVYDKASPAEKLELDRIRIRKRRTLREHGRRAEAEELDAVASQ